MNAILLAFILLGAVLVFGGFVRVNEPDPPAAPPCSDCVPRSLLVRSEARSRKRLNMARRFERQRNFARAVLSHRPSVREALDLAVETYGHPEIKRKCECESHYNPNAHNASGASGLCQFLPSTFASTPYHAQSIFSPYANALAAGWMHAHGRGGEWVCQ